MTAKRGLTHFSDAPCCPSPLSHGNRRQTSRREGFEVQAPPVMHCLAFRRSPRSSAKMVPSSRIPQLPYPRTDAKLPISINEVISNPLVSIPIGNVSSASSPPCKIVCENGNPESWRGSSNSHVSPSKPSISTLSISIMQLRSPRTVWLMVWEKGLGVPSRATWALSYTTQPPFRTT